VGNIEDYNEPAILGFLLKVNGNGDSLWYRQYSKLSGLSSLNYLFDALPTPDEGFIATGYCVAQPPDTSNVDGWILKVDSLGCVSPSECWVSQREYELQESVHGKLARVFPNPAKSWIEVELTEQGNDDNDLEIEITDLLGRKVESTKIPKKTGRIHHRFNTNNWNRGVYLVKLKKDGIPIGIRKVILN